MRFIHEPLCPEEMQQKWSLLSAEIISGMAEWRLQHPKASFREIEAEVDWASLEKMPPHLHNTEHSALRTILVEI
jgi:phage host-nuclease inhibitor protein Gam